MLIYKLFFALAFSIRYSKLWLSWRKFEFVCVQICISHDKASFPGSMKTQLKGFLQHCLVLKNTI